MLASSPSRSAALRPASSFSPSTHPTHSLSHPPFPQASSSSSPTLQPDSSPACPPATHRCHYDPVRTSIVPPNNSQFSPRSSRVAVEELRSALTRHTVKSPPYGPSGDLPRGRMSAGLTSLGGRSHPAGSHPGAASISGNDKTNHDNNYNRGSGSSNNPLSRLSGVPSTTITSTITAASPTNSGVPAVSVPPAMPFFTSNSRSNKRSDQEKPMANVTIQSKNVDQKGSQSKRLRLSKPAVKMLPRDYDQADPRDIVALISSMLLELIRFNDKIPLHQGRLTRFHSRSPPRISVNDYLQRLTSHTTLSPPILLSMVYYIDRLCALYPAFNVSSLTIHRFLISSAAVASKGLSDSFWTNKTYARAGGISLTELALLELEFLFRVEWRIVPQPAVLLDYYQSLVERCDGYEIQRG